jgi:secretion/DNA translocation related TadE-like protein
MTRARPAAGDAGSGTVWVLTAALLMVGGAAAVAVVLAVVVAHERAVTAADLSALAAAARLDDAPGRSCLDAADVARANGARLSRCQVSGLTVSVTVEVTRAAAFLPDIRTSARAGLPLPGQPPGWGG